MDAGTITAIILVTLLGVTIISLLLLAIRKRQLMQDRNAGITRQFFFTHVFTNKNKNNNANGVNSSNDGDDNNTLRAGDTYLESYPPESETSIISEEIDFNNNGPLFESWPSVIKARSQNGLLAGDHLRQQQEQDDALRGHQDNGDCDDDDSHLAPSSGEPSTYKSSVLSSFFSKSADYLRGMVGAEDGNNNNNNEMTPLENAIDEIKRGISEARWQDVYYLASKMAAEGNIDTNEKLKTALVTTSTGNENACEVPSNTHCLTPQDAEKASQLNASLKTGDFISLAARAAVFAALESAKNPVPASIAFTPGQEDADACLAQARAALIDSERIAKEREEKCRQLLQDEEAQQETSACVSHKSNSSTTVTEDSVPFVSAEDVSIDCEEFEYPTDGYSDSSASSRTKSTNSKDGCEHSKDSNNKNDVGEAEGENVDIQNDDGSTDCTRSDIPGPPSIALSNQSTIPTEASTSGGDAVFSSLKESSRGPFRRDFENEISHPMDQLSANDHEVEIPGVQEGEILRGDE